MKIVFYKLLLKRNRQRMTFNDRLIYSFLVSKTITDFKELFDPDGQHLQMDYIEVFDDMDVWYDIPEWINNHRISKELALSRQTVYTCMDRLRGAGYINKDTGLLFINKDLIRNGFFEVRMECCDFIKGELLVFYSFLIDKSMRYDYTIDTYKSKIAEEFGLTKLKITKLLNRLYEKELAKRTKDGKLTLRV